jgi:NTE family protein
MRKIGLALGGGGARGLAHIGVLKVLAEEKIPIHCIAGTSMGGVIGAYLASGRTPAEMEKFAIQLGKFKEIARLIDLRLSQYGAMKGKRIHQLLEKQLGENLTFADLQIPLALLAVDLNTGREVVLNEGKVADAVRATISVPAVFMPFKMGDYLLADGGILDNVPASTARAMGADVVVAVDVLPNFTSNRPGYPPIVLPLSPPHVPLAYRGLWHVQMMMISAITELLLKDSRPEVLIRPALPQDMDLFVGFDRPQQAIAAGEKATWEALPRLWAFLEGNALP